MMLRLARILCCGALLGLTAWHAAAFSLLGPINEPHQVGNIGYNIGGDIGAPKNLGEEYRWNTPVIYYAFDSTFLDYFGSNGVRAVEEAIAVLNNLTNMSHYSTDLSEFPLESMRINYRAQALNLLDLKTVALTVLVEELGLAEAERWVWCIRYRECNPCPSCLYGVIKRNWDPVTWEPTSYVNGVLYSYLIIEFCTGPDPLADAYEFKVDPLADDFTAITSLGAARYGAYATGLSRDDVAGLRYLLRTNNVNWETISQDSLLFYTNRSTTQLLISSNLNLLLTAAYTNDAAALTALYPGLVLSSTQPVYTTDRTTNVTAYFTNTPWAPAGWQALAFATNYVTNYVIRYQHSFANVITNNYYFTTQGSLVTSNVGPCQGPWSPPNTICTNTITNHVVLDFPSGDVFILPTNSACGYVFLSNLPPILVIETNAIVTATNQLGQQYSETLYTYFTNHAMVIHPVSCETNAPTLRQGVDRLRFVRANYDSLLGRFFAPITNYYSLNEVTNSTVVQQHLQRVVVTPDILFHGVYSQPTGAGAAFRNASFSTNSAPILWGPGTIDPDIAIGFNSVGPYLINFYSPFLVFNGLSESTAFTNFVWGTYDGSTNTPIVYPQGTSIADLEDQVLSEIQVSPLALPYGVVGTPYNVPFVANGGQAPYSWSWLPASAPLPPGLEISPGGVLMGTPLQAGNFEFMLQVHDSLGRRFLRLYSITIRLP